MSNVYAIPGKDTIENNFFKLKDRLDKAKKECKITNDFYNEKLSQLINCSQANLDNFNVKKNQILMNASKFIIENDELEGKGTKILVFCNKAEDTESKMKEYHDAFKKLYPNKVISSNRIISKNKTKNEEEFFKNFQSDKPVEKNNIQILAVMDMYSEGVHAPGLNISIMDRNISDSKSLYYQQVGRVMSSKNPTIIDFSENCNKGYVNWNELGLKCKNKDKIKISETEKYSNEINRIELEINNEISPKSYGLNKDGEIVKISYYLKEKYEWNSNIYLNNVKNRIFNSNSNGNYKYNIDICASVEPGFKLKSEKIITRKNKHNNIQ